MPRRPCFRRAPLLVAMAALAVTARLSAADPGRELSSDPSLPAAAQPLPLPIPAGQWKSLYQSVDVDLQRELEAALDRQPSWKSLIRKRKMAVGVVDLTSPEHPRFGRVNGNTMMYAASLPKIAILLAAYDAFETGTLPETEEIHADLQAMIRVSNNAAATRMIDRLGFDYIEKVLTSSRYRLYDPQRGGGLWVGKRYAKTGRRIGDPILNISHGSTATQVCRLYYMLATGRLVSPERSRQMLSDLSHPGLHHKFVGVVERRAPGAALFRKSGTWQSWHSDSILVWGREWRHYILVAMVESSKGERILRDLVPVVEALLRPERPVEPPPTALPQDE